MTETAPNQQDRTNHVTTRAQGMNDSIEIKKIKKKGKAFSNGSPVSDEMKGGCGDEQGFAQNKSARNKSFVSFRCTNAITYYLSFFTSHVSHASGTYRFIGAKEEVTFEAHVSEEESDGNRKHDPVDDLHKRTPQEPQTQRYSSVSFLSDDFVFFQKGNC